MQQNLTDILNSEGKKETIIAEFEGSELDFGGVCYKVVSQNPLELKLSNNGKGRCLAEGKGSITLKIPCDRCLKPVDVKLPIEISEEISEQDILNPEPGMDMAYLDGYELDTELLIAEAAYSVIPMKVLCRDDCKGLCSVCGKDLNEGDCGCDRFVPDPRMAAIGDIFAAAQKK